MTIQKHLKTNILNSDLQIQNDAETLTQTKHLIVRQQQNNFKVSRQTTLQKQLFVDHKNQHTNCDSENVGKDKTLRQFQQKQH